MVVAMGETNDRREWVRYSVAVVAYIVLSLFTKRFLTWTWGPFYFILTLEILPRVVNRIRRGQDEPPRYATTPLLTLTQLRARAASTAAAER